MKYFIDTNIFLRIFTDDDPNKSKQCIALLKKLSFDQNLLFTSTIVVCEIIWTLQTQYKFSLSKIKEYVEAIHNTSNLTILPAENEAMLVQALSLAEEHNIDFIDAYNARIMQANNISKVVTYDKHFKRLSDIEYITPLPQVL